MKEIFKIIKEHIVLLLGSALFTYGFFSFEYYSPSAFSFPGENNIEPHYYYSDVSLILLTAGVVLTIVDLLKKGRQF